MEIIFKVASLLDNADLELLLNKLFLHLALAHVISNPVIQSMKLLKQNNKSNLLYKFALALCQTNPITGEPIFPMMPFGLIEYQILHLNSQMLQYFLSIYFLYCNIVPFG